MAIRPKKQTPSNRGETGGGAPRGGSRSGGTPKVAPKPKVSLKPEPSSMKVKPGKYNIFGPEEAMKANKSISAARSRINTATPKVEKRALKAANTPLKTKSADAARKQSFDRAAKAVKDRNAKLLQNKATKELSDSMKFARNNSLKFNADGSRITPSQANKYNKNFLKGKPNWGVPAKKSK